MASKQIDIMLVLLAFSAGLAASDESNISDDEISRLTSSKEKLSLLSALETSQPVTISRAYSSILGDKQRHEITTPKGTIVLKGSVGFDGKETQTTMQSSSDGQYIFVKSGQNNVRVFVLSPKSHTFAYRSTLPLLNQVNTSNEDDGKR